MSSEFLRDFNFEKLIRPIARDDFFATYWERMPLLVARGMPGFYGDLITLADFDATVAAAPARFGLTRNTEEGTADIEFGADAAEIGDLAIGGLADAGTLALYDAQDNLPTLGLMCRLLARELGYVLVARVYLTPMGSRAFRPHFDSSDVFILQVMGDKSWQVEKDRRCIPGSGEHDAGDTELSRYRDEFELHQGDLLYIPRGYVHTARSEKATSLHVTVSVRSPNWEDLLHAAIRLAAKHDTALKRALPVGFLWEDARDLADGLASRLAAVAHPMTLERAATLFADEYVSRFAPDVSGHLRAMVGGPRPGPGDTVGPRRGMVYRLHEKDETIILVIGFRRIAFPDVLAEQLRFALDTASFKVRDLPGDLSDDEKAVFIERLIQEGLVEIRSDGT
jgi:hypothetical protein